MSFVVTRPESLAAAARILRGVGSTVAAHNAAVAALTTGVIPAAADEVSAPTATQFDIHAQTYRAVSAQAAVVHHVFTTTLAISAGSCTATEAANAIAAG